MLKKGISNGQRKIVELQCIAFVESEHTIDCFGNKVQAIFIAMSVQNILIFKLKTIEKTKETVYLSL